MAKVPYGQRRSAKIGALRLTQRGIGTLVEEKNVHKTGKGERIYSKYWVYVPTSVAEDKAFPFKAGDKLLITITDGKRVYLERT